MPLEGHGQTPTEEETTEFISAAKKFFRDHPNDVMAMHCTHGFNRTGFLIVSFLVEEVEYAVDMAVEEFAKARPQGIYKQDYLNELSKRFGDEEDIIPAPNRPLWEHGPVTDEDYYNGVMAREQQEQSNLGMPDTSDGVNRTRKGIPQFMDGAVPGVSFVESADERKYLQQKTRAYCGFKGNQFPGSQPVSMERSPDNDNLKLLAKDRYMVSWKADGVSQVYAFDRDNNVFIIPNVTFLHRKLGRHLTNTLVDAEMIIEKVKDEKTGKINEIPRLLIYDIIAFEDKNVGKECFTTRTQIITVELIEPRRKAMMEGKIIRENEPMSVRRKDFCFLLATYKYFDQKFMCNLGHEIDGLIFQPVDEPYTAGRFDKLLKWKPPEQCTIDFKLQIQTIERPGMLKERKGLLYVLHTDVPLGEIKVTRDLMKYEGKIIECHFNPKTKYWEFMRERTDKSFPNAYTTAKSVCNTIRYPITKEILLHYIAQFGRKMDGPQKHPPVQQQC
ncbi:mRNA capping enzyme, catalytic domain-containing protein [Ditylenchus destructor]|nr:mRNA capping enzyme, catalytic domain-containing protein [Ditylenchus destructor]